MHKIHIVKESARNELVYLTDVIRKEMAIFGLIMKVIKTVIILFIENGQLGKYKKQSRKTFFKTPKEYYKSLITPPHHPHTTHTQKRIPCLSPPPPTTPPHTIPTPPNHPRKFQDQYTVTSTMHFHTHTDQNTIAKSWWWYGFFTVHWS